MSNKQRVMFVILAIAAGGLAGIASREATGATGSDRRAATVSAAQVFTNLLSCEIPGLQERPLARGAHSIVYAGEFAPTPVSQLRSGQTRIYLYVVSGTGLVRIGGMTSRASPGDFFVIPRGVPHAVSPTAGKLRAIYFEDRS